MKLFFAAAVAATSFLVLAGGVAPVPVDYNSVGALVAQVLSAWKS